MKNILLLACILMFVQSCVINPDPIDVDIPEVEPELVLNTIGLPPSIFSVILTNTFSALIPTQDSTIENIDVDLVSGFLVDGAEMFLSYDNESFELTQLLPGIYGSLEAELLANKDYTLDVIGPNGRNLRAQTTILPSVPIGEINLEKLDDDSLFNIKLAIEDPMGEDNYFLVSNKILNDSELPDLTSILNGASNFQVFSDQEVDEDNLIDYKVGSFYSLGDTIQVSLSHITREYYDYLTAYKRVGNIFSGILSEPIRSLPDNVEGGLGYFNLAVPEVEIIVVE